MSQRQIPGSVFVNETGTAQRQIPGGSFINETVTTGQTYNDSLTETATASDTAVAARESYARPSADITTGWTPSTGTTHYTLIDEVAFDDADYIYATAAGQTDEVRVAAPSTLEPGTPLYIDYRVQGVTGGGKVTVSLYQGATLIKADTQRTADGDYVLTLSSAEWASISNWSDLRVRFVSG